jgi:hypothetical protein
MAAFTRRWSGGRWLCALCALVLAAAAVSAGGDELVTTASAAEGGEPETGPVKCKYRRALMIRCLFYRVDKNRDDALDKHEIKKAHRHYMYPTIPYEKKLVKTCDLNGDGIITRAEVTANLQCHLICPLKILSGDILRCNHLPSVEEYP